MERTTRRGAIGKLSGAAFAALLLVLMAVLHYGSPDGRFESPILLAGLNTLFLCALPLGIAFLSAKSYQSTGVAGFLLMGCGLVFFGISSLYAGWVMPLAKGPNPTVTLHNLGSLFAGVCELCGAQLFMGAVFGPLKPGRRLPGYPSLYLAIFALVSFAAFLSFRGFLPLFFDPASGPSPLRQLVLGGAILSFFLAGSVFLEIYLVAKTEFAFWYCLALWLITIGLFGVLIQPSVGSALGWAGRAAQYSGGIFLIIAFLQGKWEMPATGGLRGIKATWTLWPYLERAVAERTRSLEKMAEALEAEVADRKRADADLRAIFENTTDGLYLLDTDLRIRAANRVAAGRLSRRVDEIVGKQLQEVLPPELLEQRFPYLVAALAKGESQVIEVERSERWDEYSINPVRDDEGRVRGLVVVSHDISARREGERALAESERFHRSLFDMLNGFAYCRMIEEEGRPIDFEYLIVNRAFGAQTGLQDVVGKRASEVVPGIERIDKGLIERYGRVAAFGQAERFETYVASMARWFSVSAYSPAPGYFVSVLEDITERKLIEERLRKSEAFLEAVIEKSPNSLWISDSAGTLVRLNQACRDALHITDEEVVGKYNVFRDNIVRESGHMPEVEEVFAKGRPARFTLAYDTKALEGFKFPYPSVSAVLEVFLAPILDGEGRVANAVIQHMDITERTRSAMRLEKALAENRELLSELQHRIKNSFNMIISLASLTTDEAGNPETRASLEEFEARVRSIAQLYSFLYSSESLSEVRLDRYCEQVIETLSAVAPAVALSVLMDEVTIEPRVATPIALILTELMTNVFKHAFPVAKAGKVSISLESRSGEVRLEVRDDGVGIPEGFDPSTQKGMGLRLIAGFAGQIGGTFSMTRLEGGTASTLTFPLPRKASPPVAPP